MTTATLVSAQEFLCMPDSERYELVDGELVERSMGQRSSSVAARLNGYLILFSDERALGVVSQSDTTLRIWPEHPARIRRADGAFWAKGRLPNDEPYEGDVPVAPDLAIESVSPNDVAQELDRKVEQYFEAGVRMVWIVYPETHKVLVQRLNGTSDTIRPGGVLSGEDVVPGFELPIVRLFPELSRAAQSHP